MAGAYLTLQVSAGRAILRRLHESLCQSIQTRAHLSFFFCFCFICFLLFHDLLFRLRSQLVQLSPEAGLGARGAHRRPGLDCTPIAIIIPLASTVSERNQPPLLVSAAAVAAASHETRSLQLQLL